MAQPNVAREPSMEEILASIRRIIESNEPGGDAAPVGAVSEAFAPEGDDGEIHLTVDNDNLVDAGYAEPVFAPPPSRAPVQPVAGQPTVQAASAPRMSGYMPRETPQPVRQPVVQDLDGARALSLADVAARVRAASERSGMGAPARSISQVSPAAPAPHQAPQSAQPTSSQTARPVELRRHPSAVTNLSSAMQPRASAYSSDFEAQRAADTEMDTLAVEPVSSADISDIRSALADIAREQQAVSAPPRDAYRQTEAARPVPEEPSSAPSQSLMSRAVVDQVANAFSDLAVVVDQGPRRSIDEIAGEMLRPMLREWLDDNLPTLVERLVREEIERVARGPRR